MPTTLSTPTPPPLSQLGRRPVLVLRSTSIRVVRAPAAGAASQPVPALSTSFVVDSAVMCEVEAPPNRRFAGTVAVTRSASVAANLYWRRAGRRESR